MGNSNAETQDMLIDGHVYSSPYCLLWTEETFVKPSMRTLPTYAKKVAVCLTAAGKKNGSLQEGACVGKKHGNLLS